MRYITPAGLYSILCFLGWPLNASRKQLTFVEAGKGENHSVCAALWDDARTDGGTLHVRASV